MSIIMKILEYLFLLWVLLKLIRYGIWSFRNKNRSGSALLFGIGAIIIAFLAFTEVTGT